MNLLDSPGSGTLDSHQIAPPWKLRLIFQLLQGNLWDIHQFGNIEKYAFSSMSGMPPMVSDEVVFVSGDCGFDKSALYFLSLFFSVGRERN
jgi:hypothetical protein